MGNNESMFKILLQQFISSLDNQQQFQKYFKEHYCMRVQQWAT